MKKRIVALTIFMMILIGFMPTVFAENIDVNSGDDITMVNGNVYTVASGATATLRGESTMNSTRIVCGAGVKLTLIDVNATSGACALSFTGTGNTLTLTGTNTLKSGDSKPGIRVETGAELTIDGDGILFARGGVNGAGIGGGKSSVGGKITISGGEVHATGGDEGEEIGGGAGIGGGTYGSGGTVTISGGKVYATGGEYAGAGIGGGFRGDGGDITISGGEITATGGYKGSGIGGGTYGQGGTVTISNGAKVYAEAGTDAEDIGKGVEAVGYPLDSGSLTISDASTVVFTKNTAEHTNWSSTTSGMDFSSVPDDISAVRTIFGLVDVPWSNAQGVYTVFYDVSYDKNTTDKVNNIPASQQNIVGGDKADEPSSPTRTGYDIDGWFKEAGCTNEWYFSTDTVTSDTTLYAKWTAKQTTISYDDNNGNSGEDGTKTATYDSDMPTVPTDKLPTRTGYIFTGYYDQASGGTKYYDNTGASANTWDKEDSTYDLYAQWTIGTYDVVFDANDGSGSMANQSITYGQSANLTLNNNNFTRLGYTFNGWNTVVNGSGIKYGDGASYTMNSEGVTLYAQWLANTYEITFLPNGGSGSMSNQSIVFGQSENLYANTYTRTGYEYRGWSTSPNEPIIDYADKASYTMRQPGETLYAHWNKLYTITYYAGDGSGSASDNLVQNTETTLHKGTGFIRDGYVIEGWSINGTVYKLGDLYTMQRDVTANAVWAKDTDGDGVSDADEDDAGTEKYDPNDTPAKETVKIHLENSDGTPAQGYTFVLNSTPKEGTTDANGYVVFTGVSLSPHTLSLRSGNTELGSYTLRFVQGTSNNASITGGGTGVYSTVASNFLSLDMTIRLGGGNLIVIVDANGRVVMVINPKTGEY